MAAKKKSEKELKTIIEDLKNDLQSKNKFVRALACKSLAKIENSASAYLLTSMLSDNDLDVRFHAMQGLLKLNEIAIPNLINALNHNEWVVRKQASDILKQMAQSNKNVINILSEHVNSNDENIRYWAIKTLCEIGTKDALNIIKKIFLTATANDKICIATSILPQNLDQNLIKLFIKAFKDPVWNVRKACAFALVKLGDEVIDLILPLINSKNDDEFYWATKILAMLKSEKAVEPLLQIIKENDERMEHAISALGEIGNEKALDTLITLLNSNSWTIRKTTADALINIGEKVILKLYQIYNDPNTTDDGRYWCVRIVSAFKNDDALQVVEKALDDSKWFIRALACNVLSHFYNLTPSVIKKLFLLSKDKNLEVQKNAINTLNKLDCEYLYKESLKIIKSCKDKQNTIVDLINEYFKPFGKKIKINKLKIKNSKKV